MTQQAIARGGNLKRVAMGLVWAVVIFAVVELAHSPAGRADEPDAPQNGAKGSSGPPEFFPLPSRGEQEIMAVLDKPISVEFVEESLQDVVNDLKNLLGIEVQLDDRALDDAAMSGDTPITLPQIKGMAFRSVLSLLRKRYGLYSLIQDEMMLLTTKEVAEAQENLVLRVYPISDLVGQDDMQPLVCLVKQCVEKDSWYGAVGKGQIVPSKLARTLVIVQTQPNQDKVLQLLRLARRSRGFQQGRRDAGTAIKPHERPRRVGRSTQWRWPPTGRRAGAFRATLARRAIVLSMVQIVNRSIRNKERGHVLHQQVQWFGRGITKSRRAVHPADRGHRAGDWLAR